MYNFFYKKKKKKKKVENYPQLHISFITLENAGIFYEKNVKWSNVLVENIVLKF